MAHARRAKVKDPAKAFISTWKTDNLSTGSSTNTQVKLPLVSTGTYKFTVNWGDSTSSVITTWNQAEVTHTYATIGTYTITITGFIKGWEFNNSGDRLKIMTLVQWGCLRLGNDMPLGLVGTRGFFFGCNNITYTTTSDILNLKGTTNVLALFRQNFQATKINNIEKLDVSKVTNAVFMFINCPKWDGDVSYFNTSNITNMAGMLGGTSFVPSPPYGSFTNMGNPDIGNWDTSKVTDMQNLFQVQPLFNHNIGSWDTSNVTTMASMFLCPTNVAVHGTFNNGGSDSIKNWNTGKVTNMGQMFILQRKFNQNIGTWDVSKVTNMNATFYGASVAPYAEFNNGGSDSIKNWDVSNVTNMQSLFVAQKDFNQPIGSWNTSKVTAIDFAFYAYVPGVSVFNQDLSNWDTSKVVNMREMFTNADNFNQPIGNWNVSLVTNFTNFMIGKTNLNYSAANYDALLIGWASRPVKPSISINFGTIKRTAASTAARAILTSAPNNWTIVDGGLQA